MSRCLSDIKKVCISCLYHWQKKKKKKMMIPEIFCAVKVCLPSSCCQLPEAWGLECSTQFLVEAVPGILLFCTENVKVVPGICWSHFLAQSCDTTMTVTFHNFSTTSGCLSSFLCFYFLQSWCWDFDVNHFCILLQFFLWQCLLS